MKWLDICIKVWCCHSISPTLDGWPLAIFFFCLKIKPHAQRRTAPVWLQIAYQLIGHAFCLWLVVFPQAQWFLANQIGGTRRCSRGLMFSQVIADFKGLIKYANKFFFNCYFKCVEVNGKAWGKHSFVLTLILVASFNFSSRGATCTKKNNNNNCWSVLPFMCMGLTLVETIQTHWWGKVRKNERKEIKYGYISTWVLWKKR